MIIGIPNSATFNYSIKVEASANGTDWNVIHNSAPSSATQTPRAIFLADYWWDSKTWFRLTLTRETTDVTGALNLTSIRLLSYRFGNQGAGAEYEHPFSWDWDKNITITKTLNLTNTTDAAINTNNDVALKIGSVSGIHTIFDNNEIIAKNGNTGSTLWLNADDSTDTLGGLVSIGSGGLITKGKITVY